MKTQIKLTQSKAGLMRKSEPTLKPSVVFEVWIAKVENSEKTKV
jgi:hypothetical protein